MPEFQLDYGSSSCDGAQWFKSLPLFTQGYVEAMFFADTPEGEDWAVDMLSPEARAQIVADCDSFYDANAADIDAAIEYHEATQPNAKHPYDDTRAGADFWFTRQGHGVGFWDRGLGGIGDKLADAAHAVGECWPGLSDDGRIYF